MGKPREEAVGEVEFSAAIYEYYADNAEEFLKDEEITLLAGEGTARISRESVGVLLGIMPWNFPAYQVARFAGPNLCLGNTILLKHAPQCPSSSAFLERIFADAGFPDGAYVNIYASTYLSPADVGTELLNIPVRILGLPLEAIRLFTPNVPVAGKEMTQKK